MKELLSIPISRSPSGALRALLLALVLSGFLAACGMADAFNPPLVVKLDYAGSQWGQAAAPWVYEVHFPVNGAGPLDASKEYVSHGPYQGATLVTVNVRTDRTIYVSGARVEKVRYRNEDTMSVHADYIHPVFGKSVSPVFANLATSFGYSGGYEALEMKPDQDNFFEVGLSSVISLWDHMDFDGDGIKFRADDDEAIVLSCSLCLEGFLPDGEGFSGGFPVPLHLDIAISHHD
jgi:hypothetical protein